MLGTVLEKRFKLVAALGEGTLGRSFLGVDMRTEGRVAIKFLGRGLQSEPDAKRRFQAAIAMQLSLAGTPRSPEVLAARVDEGFPSGAPPYLIRSYVGGFSLREALQLGEPPALDVTMEVLSTLMSYLGDLESRGFRHGGITPENVILTDTGGIKVVDPGVALLVIQPGASLPNSLSNHVSYCAPGYMEPPYFEDIRGDIFSVARITRDLIEVRKEVALTDEAPEALRLIEDVLGKALNTNPDRRFTTVADFRLAFSEYLTGPRRTAERTPKKESADPQALRDVDVIRTKAALEDLDHYQILDVPKESPIQEVLSAYYRLAVQYHPDRGKYPPFDTVRDELIALSKKLNEAYTTLKDPLSRASYDEKLIYQKSTSRRPSSEIPRELVFPAALAPEEESMEPNGLAEEAASGEEQAGNLKAGARPDQVDLGEFDDASDEPRKRRLAKIFRILGTPDPQGR